jgi:FKBP-type peptidyl-prolyl cis-trans isomerase FklB
LAINGVVTGFGTALMRMHRGDRWRVYIPYQLAYGSSARSSIPAYSTLIFDLQLEDFWRKTLGDRE